MASVASSLSQVLSMSHATGLLKNFAHHIYICESGIRFNLDYIPIQQLFPGCVLFSVNGFSRLFCLHRRSTRRALMNFLFLENKRTSNYMSFYRNCCSRVFLASVFNSRIAVKRSPREAAVNQWLISKKRKRKRIVNVW